MPGGGPPEIVCGEVYLPLSDSVCALCSASVVIAKKYPGAAHQLRQPHRTSTTQLLSLYYYALALSSDHTGITSSEAWAAARSWKSTLSALPRSGWRPRRSVAARPTAPAPPTASPTRATCGRAAAAPDFTAARVKRGGSLGGEGGREREREKGGAGGGEGGGCSRSSRNWERRASYSASARRARSSAAASRATCSQLRTCGETPFTSGRGTAASHATLATSASCRLPVHSREV